MNPVHRDVFRTIILAVTVLTGIICYGVLGYMIVEGWSFIDALYQTIITISTVGFEETHPISFGGRIMTIILILVSISLFGYFLSRFVTIMVGGRIIALLRGRKMEKQIAKLHDHFIICGYGRMGKQVVLEFRQAGIPFVVMDDNQSVFDHDDMDSLLWIVGDACREEDLEQCQIKKARGLVSVLAEDQHNVYAVLTARGLNEDLRIITRATEPESEGKLLRAGADHVISPFKIGGSRIASMMLRPSITHFMDGLARAEEIRLTLIEVEVGDDSALAGRTIQETGITDVIDCIIIGLRCPGEPIDIRPPVDTVLSRGDQLIIMGRLDALTQVEGLVRLK